MDYDGMGAFFYPGILSITDKVKINYPDSELSKPPRYGTRKVVLDHSLQNNQRIVVSDDGFIGIFEKGLAETLKILNTIFATGITFGVGSEFVIERDLLHFKLTNNNSYLQLRENRGPSERNMFFFKRDSDSELNKWRSYNTRHVVPINSVKKMLDRSCDYLATEDRNIDLYQDLLLVLEGYSLYYRQAFSGAFVYGWMILETVVYHIWKEYVNTLKISSKDKKRLKESSQWTSQHYIDVLFALKKLTLIERNLLTKLRKKRNDVMHNKKTANNDESFWCLRLAAVTTLNRMLGDLNIFHDPMENPLVDMWNCRSEEQE
jgi:hypothetical protein